MAQPLFKRLHERYPGSEIHVLAPEWTLPLFDLMPEVHQTIANPFSHGELRLVDRYRFGKKLREKHYDWAIVLPNSLKSAMIPFFAHIPVRIGYAGEVRYGLLNDVRKLDENTLPLMVERFTQLAEKRNTPLEKPVPYPALNVAQNERDALLARLGLSFDKPVAAFCVGAEYGPAKRWPASHFAELAKMLSEKGYQVWLVGSDKDQDIGEEVRLASDDSCENLCGKTSLKDAITLISAATLVITNDSGLMHVAAALDKPLVALYGSSSPGFTPPLSNHARIANLNLSCSPCFKRECPLGHFDCMTKLTAEQVMKEISRLGF